MENVQMETGETITISLQDAGQIILQEQDGAVTIPPGTYHILTQEDGQIQLTADEGQLVEQPINVAVSQEDLAALTVAEEGAEKITSSNHVSETEFLEKSDITQELTDNVSENPQVLENDEQQEECPNEGEGPIQESTATEQVPEGTSDQDQILQTEEENKHGTEENTAEQELCTDGLEVEDTNNVAKEVSQGDINVEQMDTSQSQDDTTPENSAADNGTTPGKQLDLTKPIAVTNQTEVVINGKKCILMANPSTGELCAYPVLPPPGKRRRGRPRKEEMVGVVKQKIVDSVDIQQDAEQATSAAEGLLELRNTGPDGVRRSGRARKKARLLDDYEVLEVSDDSGDGEEEEGPRRKTDDSKDYVPVTPYVIPGSGVKRGRGRPRRYPPPGQINSNTQIPAVIIPGANGQTLMMAPIQGLSNLQAFQEQVKSLPSLLSKDTGQSEGGDAELLPIETSALSEEAELTEAASSAEAITAAETSESKETEGEGDGQTIIQIPENLLPMFLPKKDPVKLGLKASESELGKLKCSKCDFQAYYSQQYQAHIASHAEDIHKCKCCNFLTFDMQGLLAHFKKNHPRCICTECDFMAEHAYIIKRHMMRHSASGCTCDMCGRVYKDQYILKMHIKMVHMPAEVLFECTVCSKKFTRKAHLKRHLRIHEPEKPFKCPHCDYRGCERSDISKHLLIHEEPRHLCEVCGKAFRHIKNKELHLKRHNGQRDYKCGVCDFYGYTFTDIRKHIERKHADIKTLVCDKCGSAFKSEALLKEHQKQQCDMLMIEQALAIATGGSNQATIQVPASFNLDGQQIMIDGQQIAFDSGGQVNITVESVTLPESELQTKLRRHGDTSEEENITLTEVTEDQLHESLVDNAISVTESQVIDTDELEQLQAEGDITEAQIIECDDVLQGGIISVTEAQVIETVGLRGSDMTVTESQVIEDQGLQGMVMEGDEVIEGDEEGIVMDEEGVVIGQSDGGVVVEDGEGGENVICIQTMDMTVVSEKKDYL